MNLKAKWCFFYSPKKRRYETELDAKIELAMIMVRNDPNRHEDRYYYHSYCKGWHFTSMKKNLTAGTR